MIRIKLTVKLLLLTSILSAGIISAQKYEQVIKEYVNSEKSFQRLNSELKEFKIVNVDPSKSLQGEVIGIQQTMNGIPIFGRSANVLIREGKVLSFADTFIKNYPTEIKGKENGKRSTLVAEAAKKLNGLPTLKNVDGKEEPIKVETVYFAKDGVLNLGYEFSVEEKNSSNGWRVIISAEDGSVLYQENTTLSCSFHDDAYGHDSSVHFEQNQSSILPNTVNAVDVKKPAHFVLAPDNASYNVFPLPIEAPTFGNRQLIANPWDLAASPEGWHSDGTNHYTVTRGNNAYAYTDEKATNTPQFVPDGGANRVFDFPLDITQPHRNYTAGSVTNLFYINNKVHDVFYKFGFTETARNYQTNNFGKGGAGNDPVLAEARDGEGFNNANFNPQADGTSGRMQMYLVLPQDPVRSLFYNSPSNYTTRTPATQPASFGPALFNISPVTGDLSLTTPVEGCTAISEDLTGKIALIQRGTCSFVDKVKNAQSKGAVAVIVYNAPTSSGFGTMGGGPDPAVTIPSVLIENSEGSFLAGELTNGAAVNVTLKDDSIYRDGSLDNGVITHEYGHGISNRLTGTGSGCLSFIDDNEQMGEGWSDFFALMLTNKQGDNASVPRGMGTFFSNQPITGSGIRPAKYSPDFAINNYTYGKTNGMKINRNFPGYGTFTIPDAHSIGFIWATMLWDLHWNYVEKYGYNSNVLADPNSGSAKVLQLVVDGLKLQPCNPSFIQGRDALLAADLATTGGADKCMIWKTFAKRGLGVNANPGGLNGLYPGADHAAPDLNDQVEDFTVPAECGTLAVREISNSKGISIYPNPVKNEFTIKTPTGMNLSGITTISIYDFTGKIVSKESVNLNKQNTVRVDQLINGAYIVKITGNSIDYSQKIIISK
nr:T9SS-dependent M36 family metallopeptidase [uncultured Chryseobacterium sp.]